MRPNKIVAIGDIHIFNSKRFEEHFHVFQNFYKVLDEERPDVVVIAGDVIDSKLRLSPEQINLCRDFLYEIANRAPIVMIPGNHDCNLANKMRLDSLTPIVMTLWSEITYPIHYLKDSGVFNIMGIDWVIWSCIDDQSNPWVKSKTAKSGEYCIGLYHGVISGAKTTDGYGLQGGIDLAEFKDCDIVIAADIHQQQSFRNGEINYTGSLIQVSVNENPQGTCLVYTDNGSGYDLRVREVRNDFATINYKMGDVAPRNVLPTQKIRLQYNTIDFSRTSATEAAKTMKSLLNVKSVDVVPIARKKDSSVVKMDDKSEISSLNLGDYFKEYVTKAADKLGLDKDKLADSIDRLSKYDTEFSKGEIKEFEVGDYSVDRVVMDNFLSFAPIGPNATSIPENNIVDLDREGLIGISGKNRVGKSSIIKAIQFALFNEMPSNSSAAKMINKHNRDLPASVAVYFVKAGKNYRITRTLTPDKKGTKVSVDLRFEELENGMVTNDLTKESRPYTETEVRKYLGINETFEMLSLFSAQKRQTEFIDCKNAERLKLVNKFLGLQNFELKEENVKDRIKTRTAEYNYMLKAFDRQNNIVIMEGNLNKNQFLLKMDKEERRQLEQELEELEFIYDDIQSVYTSNLKTANKLINEPVSLREVIQTSEQSIEDLKRLIQMNEELAQQHESDAQLKCEQFGHLYGHHPADHVFNFDAITEEKKKSAVIEFEIKQLEKQMSMDTCGGCGRGFTPKDKKKVQTDLVHKQQEIRQVNAIAEAEEQKYQVAKSMIKEIESLIDSADDLREKENSKLENRIKDLTIRIKSAQSEISEYDKVQDARHIVDVLKGRIEEYNLERTELQKRISKLTSNLSVYESAITSIEKEINHHRAMIKQVETAEEELNLLKVYRKIVNKDGLPLYILMSKIDEINEKVNTIVNQVFPFNIEFSVDDERGELKIQFSYDEDADKNDVGLASGSETFVINLCIKVALSQISALPKIDTVFIDEGYDSLDKDTIERIPELFGVLTNYYKNVITISHLDDVKDMCSHQIRLERKGKYTEIV